MLATLHEDDGEVAIKGLTSFDWTGGDYPEDDLPIDFGILDGVQLIGRGTVGSRLWSKPSVSVLGIDCPSVDKASNVLLPNSACAGRAAYRARCRRRPRGRDADGST